VLHIRCRIINTNLVGKTVSFGYKLKKTGDKEHHKNVFKFDVQPPCPMSFWFMREYTSVFI